ncbi:MAG: aldehyde dehydrogenase (NADP(+)) [Chitinophagaceae bacterium]
MKIQDTTIEAVEQALIQSNNAFVKYAQSSLKERATLMREIAIQLDLLGDDVIRQAMEETNLTEVRLKGERARTIFQLNSYADACERGEWMEVSINTADPQRVPPKPDIRKTKIPLGPVVVFGSSNFPFAYSTAGGDTASALAAGCTVIVKAHPAHPLTSNMVASAIKNALKELNMDENIFIHLHGASNQIGEALVKNPLTKAVGFTGSYQGGMALFNWANQRHEPIPVFAEMGSVNPVFLFPEKLKENVDLFAQQFAESITLGVGQFCTNPGLLIGIDGKELDGFAHALGEKISMLTSGKMLHPGIAKSYKEKSQLAINQENVQLISTVKEQQDNISGSPMIASIEASKFLGNPLFSEEVFGPFSLLIKCKSLLEMNAVAASLKGQLTSTFIATENEIEKNKDLINLVASKCGRLILNGVPTGVEVCLAMQHGGPFPATTDSRFTSVGGDAIKRFARPIAYQNFNHQLLPEELKNNNPLGIWRTINNKLTKESV